MIAYALAMLFATGGADSDARCVFQGKLSLTTHSGAPDNPAARSVVYVKWVPRKLWPQTPRVTTVNQKNRQFDRQVVVVLQHDSVKFVNQDNVEHSVFANDEINGFDLPRSKKGETGTATFGELGAVRVQCDIHEKMRTDVLVVQNPYFVVPGDDGSWRLPPLPLGDYELVAWEVNGGRVQSKKLRCEGETTVELPVLKEEKEKAVTRKNGQEYREYNP
jgi:hypothetical protein